MNEEELRATNTDGDVSVLSSPPIIIHLCTETDPMSVTTSDEEMRLPPIQGTRSYTYKNTVTSREEIRD